MESPFKLVPPLTILLENQLKINKFFFFATGILLKYGIIIPNMALINIVLIIFSSIIYTLAVPNGIYSYGNLFFGFIALIPLFYVIFTSSKQKHAMIYSGIFGFLSSSLIYFWLLFFEDFSIWTLSGVAVAHTLYFLILGAFLYTAGKKNIFRPFIAAAIWVSYEYLKSIGYLGFPWNLAAHSAGIAPFVQIADITGQWGISFLIVLMNAMLLETMLVHNKSIIKSWIFTALLFIGSISYGIYTNNTDIPWEKTLTVSVVQQNADSWISGQEMESIRKGQNLTRIELQESKVKPDLIVWSENAFRYPYIENSLRYTREPQGDPFVNFLGEVNTPILVGSPYILDRKTMDALNAVLLISPKGKIIEYYGKNHPVPFAENIPFWNLSIVSSFFKNVIGLNNQGWSIGKPNIIFKIPLSDGTTLNFGAPICFEDSFPYISREFVKNGADLLINLSNDSWSKTVSGETQHLAAARLRAIENRRVLIRSTNAGVSTIIDPWGKMNYTLPLFESATFTATIPVYQKESLTVYTIMGNWFPISLIFILIIYLFYDVYIQKRRGYCNTPPR